MTRTVRTRFAPSPTGLLHIGGARTALFNWLFAKHHGGEYLLRIEDTDQSRNTPENVQAIIDGLSWLGIESDFPPVFQSTRAKRHREVVDQMLEQGSAYRCYCTQEELAAMRAQAEKEKRPFLYDGRWRDCSPDEWPKDRPWVVRIKAPKEGSMKINDLVQGEVKVENKILDDMILLRSDGTPVYMLAVVVDDYDMGITHVIRGDDHLSNAFRQAMIWDAMGWQRPEFAHLPLINGPDGKKYSKRHGAVGIAEFAQEGYLPQALTQYLLSLGWWHSDIDHMAVDQAAEYFDLTHMNKAAARMDFKKLTHINAAWMKKVDPELLLKDMGNRLSVKQKSLGSESSLVEKAINSSREIFPLMLERARTLLELSKNAEFLLQTEWTEKGTALVEKSSDILESLQSSLENCAWNRQELHDCIEGISVERKIELKEVAQPLRAALTGGLSSPPIDATLVALGREESLNRIKEAIKLHQIYTPQI